VKTPNTEF